jgi:hypothetical protein
MESPHAATSTTAQIPPAATATRHPDRIDASRVPLVAAASAGGYGASKSRARVRVSWQRRND